MNLIHREFAFIQNVQHFAADIAGGAHNCNLVAHNGLLPLIPPPVDRLVPPFGCYRLAITPRGEMAGGRGSTLFGSLEGGREKARGPGRGGPPGQGFGFERNAHRRSWVFTKRRLNGGLSSR